MTAALEANTQALRELREALHEDSGDREEKGVMVPSCYLDGTPLGD